MKHYVISDIREEDGLQVVEFWSEPRIANRTVELLTRERTFGLMSSVIYNLQHVVLRFSPLATDVEERVRRYLEHFKEVVVAEMGEELDERIAQREADSEGSNGS